MSPFLEFNTDFSFYGSQHIAIIILTISLSIGLPLLAKRYFSAQQQLWTSRIMAILISSWVIVYDVILLYLGKFNYKTDLPLDIYKIKQQSSKENKASRGAFLCVLYCFQPTADRCGSKELLWHYRLFFVLYSASM
jgi:hypothetical protein